MNNKENGSILLSVYARDVEPTDMLSEELDQVLQGLYGEVGAIISTVKTLAREKTACPGYKKAAEEEFGDTLWYLAALCRRLNSPLEDVFIEATNHEAFKKIGAASDIIEGPLACVVTPIKPSSSLDETLIRLGQSAANLLSKNISINDLVCFARFYLDSLHAAELAFSDVARGNLKKARGAFLDPTSEDLIGLDFDEGFDIEEQLPRSFKIRINERKCGRSYLQMNDVFIGDPLTDNIASEDDYRFHDVFHLAYAAILHWSPVTRALLKRKRKSNPAVDEEQDSGRAIVVEEGLTAWIFTRAKELNYFEGQGKISLGMLKTIKEFVRGYEVDKCPLKLWEKAILEGYAIFRELKINRGGWIICNREQRTIKYEPFEPGK